jgi:hypothetical protein
MASPPGTKGDHMGIWQSAMCFKVWLALLAIASLPRGKAPQRMPQEQSWDLLQIPDQFKLEVVLNTVARLAVYDQVCSLTSCSDPKNLYISVIKYMQWKENNVLRSEYSKLPT